MQYCFIRPQPQFVIENSIDTFIYNEEEAYETICVYKCRLYCISCIECKQNVFICAELNKLVLVSTVFLSGICLNKICLYMFHNKCIYIHFFVCIIFHPLNFNFIFYIHVVNCINANIFHFSH